MSLLISSPDPELIRALAFGHKPSTADLHATGVDIELLEAVYAIVKPELNFFPGAVFTTLQKSFRDDVRSTMDRRLPAAWLSAFPQAGTFGQVILLDTADVLDVNGCLVRGARELSACVELDYYAELRVYLGKQGLWLVWTNFPDSHFEVCQTPREAVEIAQTMLPAGAVTVDPLALGIAWRLAAVQRQHVVERESRLRASRNGLERIQYLLGPAVDIEHLRNILGSNES